MNTYPEHKGNCGKDENWKQCPACVQIRAEHDHEMRERIEELRGDDEKEWKV